MQSIARFSAAITDPTRLRLLRLLRRQEFCVCELGDTLRMPQYKISRHLREPRAAGLVEALRDGRWMHYRLAQHGAQAHLMGDLLEVLYSHADTIPVGKKDDANLQRRLMAGKAGRCLSCPAG